MQRRWRGAGARAGHYRVMAAMALLAAPAVSQPLKPAPPERIATPVVEAAVLEGDRVAGGVLESVGQAQINREGEIGFASVLLQGGRRRPSLFVWANGRIEPLALEGQETGSGPLIFPNNLPDFAWDSGGRAVFVGAADQNRNGRYDPGVDPQILFLATRGRLTPLVRLGEHLEGGTLIRILSFMLNGSGQVAIQALVDRNGDGSYDPAIDTAAIYRIADGRITLLLSEGDRVGDRRVRGLDSSPLNWQLNNRGEIVLMTSLQQPPNDTFAPDSLVVIDRFGNRLLVRTGLHTPLGTLGRVTGFGLGNRGEVVFPAALEPQVDAQVGLFRIPLSPVTGRVETLAGPGISGPGGTRIRDVFADLTVTDDGAVGFCGLYRQDAFGIDGASPDPAACFVLGPDFLYEVVREGTMTPWGLVGEIQALRLNNPTQAAVQIRVTALPLDTLNPFDTGTALLFWEDGVHVGLVGPGDRIPGGRVGLETRLIGLSDTGLLAFDTTVANDVGSLRHGIFIVVVQHGQT